MASLMEDLNNGKTAGVYLFYGEEAYKRQYYKKALKAAVLRDDTMNYEEFSGRDIDWQAVYDATQTLPFLADRRLVVVENSGKFKAGKAGEGKETQDKGVSGIERILNSLPSSCCLAFFEESAAKNKKIFKQIASMGRCEECAEDTEADVINWLAGGFASFGKKVRRSTLELLISRVGMSYSQLRTEVEKLAGYTGDRDVVENADVLAVSTQNIESRIFDLLRAMSEKNGKEVLRKYHDLLENREHPLYLMAMIRSQFRTMLQVAELGEKGLSPAEIAKAVGRPVFAVNQMKRYLRTFSKAQIISMLEEINETDRKCKSGLLVDQIGVELMLIKFSG